MVVWKMLVLKGRRDLVRVQERSFAPLQQARHVTTTSHIALHSSTPTPDVGTGCTKNEGRLSFCSQSRLTMAQTPASSTLLQLHLQLLYVYEWRS
jgi:hypothetical protein